jgi:ABC-type multidrug transport system permease subunit
LIGFGLAMLKKSLTSNETIWFKLFTEWNDNLLPLIVVFTALITLCTTFAYGVARKMRYDKCLAYIFAGIYVVFILICTIIEGKKAYF